ncbi:MAG: nicotinate (nicotinamide) nucleotide adenylyltransferase [Candidatus Dormibacteria bacterium]
MNGVATRLPAGTRRLVILGGSFDPVHSGHLAILEEARHALDAQVAWLLPTGAQPLRGAALASIDDRLAMAEAAVRGRRALGVCELEARRPGPSHTVDTAAELATRLPGVERWWLLGADAARRIGAWRRHEELLARERFGLVNRAGVPAMDLAEAGRLGFAAGRTRLLQLHSPPVSASEIRGRLAAGMSVAGMLPEAVAEVIRQRGLYRAGRGRGMDNALDDLC